MEDALSKQDAAELRHELRTPVNHIVGYAEMLREDVPDGSSAAVTLDAVVSVAREALEGINSALPPSGNATRTGLESLLVALREPQSRLLEATEALRAGSGDDVAFVADVHKIAEAARRLTDPPRPREHRPTPAAARAVPVVVSTVPAAPAAPTAPAAPGTARILVVDDVEENCAVLERRLHRQGYDVETAVNGRDALARLARDRFDLVLLDVMMPEMDGYEVLERLKASPEWRNIPVIMISALDDLSSVVRCIERGAEDYLTKPFDPVLLKARIGASLEKKRWHDREADYRRQVATVIDAAGAIERGTYVPGALALLGARDDALGRLARVFDSMAEGVRARESRLRDQLRELRADVSIATTEFATLAADATEDARDALHAGDLLAGRYEVQGVIGRGGMGIVYQALDRELGEQVAVKMLRRELLSGDEAVLERFKSEIRLARRISHHNVVRTHDLGESDGAYFVTMEFVRGLTVRELLETRGRLGVSSTLALARQLVDALTVAHTAGVIHRDVKPENVLLDGDGVLKVMDFGIARLAERSTNATQAGMIVGTPAYMAPEQLVGADEIDARADLYAVGVVMYECLTGRAPFEAPSMVALIGKVLTTNARAPAEVSSDVPPAVSALVMQLLAKEAGERPASAERLRELLAELG
jgi:CheY-like chemotaxis protein